MGTNSYPRTLLLAVLTTVAVCCATVGSATAGDTGGVSLLDSGAVTGDSGVPADTAGSDTTVSPVDTGSPVETGSSVDTGVIVVPPDSAGVGSGISEPPDKDWFVFEIAKKMDDVISQTYPCHLQLSCEEARMRFTANALESLVSDGRRTGTEEVSLDDLYASLHAAYDAHRYDSYVYLDPATLQLTNQRLLREGQRDQQFQDSTSRLRERVQGADQITDSYVDVMARQLYAMQLERRANKLALFTDRIESFSCYYEACGEDVRIDLLGLGPFAAESWLPNEPNLDGARWEVLRMANDEARAKYHAQTRERFLPMDSSPEPDPPLIIPPAWAITALPFGREVYIDRYVRAVAFEEIGAGDLNYTQYGIYPPVDEPLMFIDP